MKPKTAVEHRHHFPGIKPVLYLFWETVPAFVERKIPQLGAALAFYTIFAIAPMFLICLSLAGLWFGDQAARHELFGQLAGLVGDEGAEALQAMVAAANKPRASLIATIIGFATLFFSATTVFIQLQDGLNTVWNVVRIPGRGLRHFIMDRVLSFATMAAIAFILLVSLVLNAFLAALGKYMQDFVANEIILQTVNFVVSLGVITVLFAAIFKILPDVKIRWHDVWIGALSTALLFDFGKFLLGFYLGRGSIGSAYGAAGSFVIVLMWVYYSAQILLFGAKYTELYANKYGSKFVPKEGAREMKCEEKPPTRKAA
jgi:membrane protein